MRRFQLVVYYTDLDGVDTSSKHEFEAVDLSQAVSIGRNMVESICVDANKRDTVYAFTVKSRK